MICDDCKKRFNNDEEHLLHECEPLIVSFGYFTVRNPKLKGTEWEVKK